MRVSVARVDQPGPFSDLPGVRRVLVPLDAPIGLRFAGGASIHAGRFGVLRFDGSPPPTSQLPDGPSRDFNLMLRGDARGEVLPRTLVDSMLLPPAPGMRWLAWLDSGHARIGDGAADAALGPGDAALIGENSATPRVLLEGSGEIVLVKLYP